MITFDKGADTFYIQPNYPELMDNHDYDENLDFFLGIEGCTSKEKLSNRLREMADKIDRLPDGVGVHCSCE